MTQEHQVEKRVNERKARSGHRPLIGLRASQHAPPSVPAYHCDKGFHACTHALSVAGGSPIGVAVNLPEDALRAIFEHLDGLCLPGGPDLDPARYGESPHPALTGVFWPVDVACDATELLMARWALDAGSRSSASAAACR